MKVKLNLKGDLQIEGTLENLRFDEGLKKYVVHIVGLPVTLYAHEEQIKFL